MSKIQFTKEQAEFLMVSAGSESLQEAIEVFVKIIKEERIDPKNIPTILKRLMEMRKA